MSISAATSSAASRVTHQASNSTTAMDDPDSYECMDDEALVSDRLPSTNHVIRGQKDAYAVGRRLAPGKYGAVYEVLRKRDGKHFAAKLEVIDVNTNALNMDYLVLKAAAKAQGISHIAELVDRGKIEGHFKFLVMRLLGDNLHKLRMDFQDYRFSAPTALRLALEMLTALEQLHSLGYVHRDVKPSNFVIHTTESAEQCTKSPQQAQTRRQTRVYLIDFGLCRQYRSSSTGELKPPRVNTQFRGSARYASLAAHREEELYQRDDLESWLYVVVEFMTGLLPWAAHHRDAKAQVQAAKEHARTQEGAVELLKYCPRGELYRLMRYLDGLAWGDPVDYASIRALIQLAMSNNDIPADEPYDWEQPEEAGGETEDKQSEGMRLVKVNGPSVAEEEPGQGRSPQRPQLPNGL